MNPILNHFHRLPQEKTDVVIQEESVSERDIYDLILTLQNEFRNKFDDLSEEVGDVKACMLRAEAVQEAHNVPVQLEKLDTRLKTMELEQARTSERNLTSTVGEHDKRIKVVETIESERNGRRKLFEWIAAIAAFLATFGAIIELYRLVRGR